MSYEARRDDLIRKLFARGHASTASLSAKYNLPQSVIDQIVTGVGFVKPNEIEPETQKNPTDGVRNKYAGTMPRPVIVLGTVAKFYGLTAGDLKSTAGLKDTAFARQVAMLMLYEFTPLTKAGVGKILERDRTTVHHALRKIGGMVSEGEIPEIHELRQRIANNLDKDQHVKIAA
jgi:hypothetical protein